MCIEGLHRVFTQKNFRVLFVTPYENQVRLIFMRLKELINESPLLKNDVYNMTMNPYMIKFKNGSALIGFTTGAASNNSASSVRGQRGDMIILD